MVYQVTFVFLVSALVGSIAYAQSEDEIFDGMQCTIKRGESILYSGTINKYTEFVESDDGQLIQMQSDYNNNHPKDDKLLGLRGNETYRTVDAIKFILERSRDQSTTLKILSGKFYNSCVKTDGSKRKVLGCYSGYDGIAYGADQLIEGPANSRLELSSSTGLRAVCVP